MSTLKTIHICNTFFEWELEQHVVQDLEKKFSINSTFLQLQFLPLLYASTAEPILVTDFPTESYDHSFFLLKHPPREGSINSWGYSKAIAAWAKKNHLFYEMPPWELVRKINSKEYSFTKSPLPGAALIYNIEQASLFLNQNYVWKSCFGTAGRGHYFSKNVNLLSFLENEWKKGLPVIAEPWVDRICDFSTQWKILQNQEIRFLGVTFLQNTNFGTYRGNIAGNLELESTYANEIHDQKNFVQPVLKEMAQEGYFGEVGIDAMIYHDNATKKHQPIVEINARKTMGFVCLMLRKYIAPHKSLTLEYIKKKTPSKNFLPSFLQRSNGQKIHFSKQLSYTIG